MIALHNKQREKKNVENVSFFSLLIGNSPLSTCNLRAWTQVFSIYPRPMKYIFVYRESNNSYVNKHRSSCLVYLSVHINCLTCLRWLTTQEKWFSAKSFSKSFVPILSRFFLYTQYRIRKGIMHRISKNFPKNFRKFSFWEKYHFPKNNILRENFLGDFEKYS